MALTRLFIPVLTRTLLLTTASLLSVPALAAGRSPQSAPSALQGPARAERHTSALHNVSVAYYNADPTKGGQLLKTVTVSRPKRHTPQQTGQGPQSATPRANPWLAQAPTGAKFAVVKRGEHAQVIDLSRALPRGKGPGHHAKGQAAPRHN